MGSGRYQPLQLQGIRLLRVLNDDGISMRLEQHNVSRAPKYVALSYVWGRGPYRKGRSSSATYSIRVDGEAFPVQENLHDALSYLAWRIRELDCLLWVDSICVNQEDLVERSEQVLLMRHIYENAHAVYGWLSLPFDERETALAAQLMRKFNELLHDGLQANNDDIHAASVTISDKDLDIFPHPDTECHKAWMGISEMLNQAYWRRTWIYQEATGPTTTKFWCGNHWFNKVHLSAAVYIAYLFGTSADFDEYFKQSVAFGPVSALNLLRRLDGTFYTGTSLVELLQAFRQTLCTDPRDKVFAPRNLAHDVSPTDLVPNYTKTIQETYCDVVRFSLSQPEHGLEILGCVAHPVPNSTHTEQDWDGPELPSWMPDWRVRTIAVPFYKIMGNSGNRLPSSYRPAGHHVSHGGQIDGSQLKFSGVRVDRINQLSSHWHGENALNNAEVQSWACLVPSGIYSHTGETFDKAFRRTVVADMQTGGRARGNSIDWEVLHSRNDGISPSESKLKSDLSLALRHACYGRRFCWTEKGYMGIVPAATQDGDEICVLYGGLVLYALRKLPSGQHSFVGECYVHGLMDGETLRDGVQGAATVENFVLV
ncbi:hypothetical protein MMC16_005909 [Acarospora aff. strigata]|nr:hypothetical protein [Acarospora aff. strigata]